MSIEGLARGRPCRARSQGDLALSKAFHTMIGDCLPPGDDPPPLPPPPRTPSVHLQGKKKRKNKKKTTEVQYNVPFALLALSGRQQQGMLVMEPSLL